RTGTRLSVGGTVGSVDVAALPATVVDLQRRPLGGALRRRRGAHEPPTGEALGRLRPQLAEADHDALGRRGGVAGLDRPLLAAKSGSTRAPNQVSACRQRSPSAR